MATKQKGRSKKIDSYKLQCKKLSTSLRSKRGDRSIQSVAEEIGINRSVLYRIERNQVAPNLKTFIKICTWLGGVTIR